MLFLPQCLRLGLFGGSGGAPAWWWQESENLEHLYLPLPAGDDTRGQGGKRAVTPLRLRAVGLALLARAATRTAGGAAPGSPAAGATTRARLPTPPPPHGVCTVLFLARFFLRRWALAPASPWPTIHTPRSPALLAPTSCTTRQSFTRGAKNLAAALAPALGIWCGEPCPRRRVVPCARVVSLAGRWRPRGQHGARFSYLACHEVAGYITGDASRRFSDDVISGKLTPSPRLAVRPPSAPPYLCVSTRCLRCGYSRLRRHVHPSCVSPQRSVEPRW